MATAAADVLGPAEKPVGGWRPSAVGWGARLGVLVSLGAALLWLMLTIPGAWAQRVSLAIIFAIIGLSLNVILGYTGQVSLGHHAFVGLSAFLSAFLVTEKQQTFWVGMLGAIIIGAVSAGLLGLIALRIKGLYLALITLAYGFMAENSLFNIPALTRGGAGMPAPRPTGFGGDNAFSFLCLLCLAAVIFADWRLLKSKAGRAILAIKESEAVAATYGINVTFHKVIAFLISGAFAGLAGTLFAARNSTVVSVDFEFRLSLLWVLMVVVGGLGNRVGVVIGSAFFALFPALIDSVDSIHDFVQDTLGLEPEIFNLIVGPLLALITLIQFPGGIAEQISPLTRWLGGQRFSLHGGGPHRSAPTPRKPALGRRKPGRHAATNEAQAADSTGPKIDSQMPPDESGATPVGASKETD